VSIRAVVGGFVAVGAGLFAYASLIERNLFGVRRESIDVLEPESRNIRVLHLSDIHLAPWQRRKIEWIRGLVALQPDLIVVTGDSLGHRDAVSELARALSVFEGIPGVYVHGSNDYFAPRMPNPFTYLIRPSEPDQAGETLDTDGLDAVYSSLGWLDLNNASGRISVNGSSILFTGTDDPHLDRDQLDTVARSLDEALGEDLDPASAIVGVTHAPYRRVLDTLTTLGADAIFAGHTHGGQVCIPGFGALTTNSDLPLSLARGLSVWNRFDRSAFLNVSAGIGTSIYAPVRFACPPEAVLVTLRAKDIGYA
jgi:predicted MPP superfamily phosphohydrolase